MLLEIACFNSTSALIAQQHGADRIELCEDYEAGGITPSVTLFEKLRFEIHIPICVMIRPRGGNFEYSDSEFEKMKHDVLLFKKLKADGFVFGILKANTIDTSRNKELVELASPLPCTFHRAFDEVEDSFSALEEITDCGFTRILTSGKSKTALEGAELISKLIEKAKNRLIIIPGGGIRASYLEELILKTGATEVHSSAIAENTDVPSVHEIEKIKLILNR